MNSPPAPSLLRKEGVQYSVLQWLGAVEKVFLTAKNAKEYAKHAKANH
jgi:hypothetical protein